MGLDFSHGEAHWAYSGFNRFRNKLWAAIGGFPSYDQILDGPLDPAFFKFRDHPLFELFNHSDCDGKISKKHLKKMIPALRQAVSLWLDDDYDKQGALSLADGMEEALENKETFEFC